jgi:prephenate dehydrogenase
MRPRPMHSRWSRVAILGVGLIGGSIGRALLERRLAKEVVGIGRRQQSLDEALRGGCVTRVTTDPAAGVADADVVVLATGVAAIPPLLDEVDAAVRPGTLLTDAGSTKTRIVAAWQRRRTRRARFVGAHPIAGSHRRGPGAADADLFEGRVTVLTPGRSTPDEDVEAVGGFWASLGSTVFVTTPREHDRILAATSHAPHVMAAAVAASLRPGERPFTAGGWRDTTRIAAGDPGLWADILLDNAPEVARALARVAARATELLEAIEADDRNRLVRLLARAKEARDAVAG